MHGDTIVAKYSYLWDGTKLSATDSAGNGLYYSGSLIYTKHGAALTMESCAFTGGRFVAKKINNIKDENYHTDGFGSPSGHSITGTELYDFLQKCITAGVPITSN